MYGLASRFRLVMQDVECKGSTFRGDEIQRGFHIEYGSFYDNTRTLGGHAT